MQPTDTIPAFPLPPDTPQFFFDDNLIGYQHLLTRRWLPAKVSPSPVLVPEYPWEGRALVLYGTVLEMPEGGYRMYYSTFNPNPNAHRAGFGNRIMLAESTDGLRWTKPDLGIVAWEGSTANNIVFMPPLHTDSATVVFDSEDTDFPYKMLLFHLQDMQDMWGQDWGLYSYQSRDGLRWEAVPGLRLRAGDRTNLMSHKCDGNHVAFTRRFPPNSDYFGGRAVWRTESADFADWTTPELALTADLQDEPLVELYGMSVFERHGWYIGLVEHWQSSPDKIEVQLALSRDSKYWFRPQQRSPFIAGEQAWNQAWVTCASNGPMILNEQMVFYFGGRGEAHDWDSAQVSGAIGYASLPLDRFCALEGKRGGQVTTVPLRWPGGELALNADTRLHYESHPGATNGEIAVEVLDGDGNPLPAWSGEAKATFQGNTHCRGAIHNQLVKWPAGTSMEVLSGQTIKLRFHLNHARLFTFEARAQL